MTEGITPGRPRIVLSPAEIAVLDELLRDGPGNREIGKRLHLAEDTVKTHFRKIMAKTGTQTRTELAVRIMRDHYRIEIGTQRDARMRASER